MNEDNELLRQFAEERSQEAFTELVQRKINLVYATALRQVGGDPHLAAEVVQGVFLSLAYRASKLAEHPVLTAWLYTTTRFIASKAVRSHRRWQRREQEANAMSELADTAEPAWDELRDVIDEALHELNEKDRAVILLRFFENRSLADVGRDIGVAENAARMRIERALEKLRGRLARRGITSTAAALGLVLANQPMVAAPAGLATSVVGASVIGATAVGSGALTFLGFMSTAKIVTGAVCLTVIAGLGGYALHTPPNPAAGSLTSVTSANAELQTEIANLKAENQRLRQDNQKSLAGAAAVKGTPAMSASVAELSPLDRLRVLADAQKGGYFTMRLPFVDGKGKVSSKFAELFALTPTQTEAMQQAYDKARDRIGELAAASAATHLNPDGKFVIEVKPFEGGAQVYDDAMDAFGSILGAERNTAFVQLIGSQIGDELSQFGAEERTLTIGRGADKDGQPTYSISDQRRSPNVGNGSSISNGVVGGTVMVNSSSGAPVTRTSGRMTSSSQSVSRSGLEQRLGPLMKLVPPNM